MKLNAEQQKKVEDNLGLVNKVINDKVHGPYYLGMYTRDDLFQIGCIGLCKAAATDKGGNFSMMSIDLQVSVRPITSISTLLWMSFWTSAGNWNAAS